VVWRRRTSREIHLAISGGGNFSLCIDLDLSCSRHAIRPIAHTAVAAFTIPDVTIAALMLFLSKRLA
jgi:hypothetical protein